MVKPDDVLVGWGVGCVEDCIVAGVEVAIRNVGAEVRLAHTTLTTATTATIANTLRGTASNPDDISLWRG